MLCLASNGLWAMGTLYGQSKPLAIWKPVSSIALQPLKTICLLAFGLSAVGNGCLLRCSKAFSLPPTHDKISLTISNLWVIITLCGRFVSLEDAERTIKTGQPPEMRMEVSATATAPQPPRAAAAAAAETARAAPARTGAPAQNGPAAPAEREKVHRHQTHRPCHRTALSGLEEMTAALSKSHAEH